MNVEVDIAGTIEAQAQIAAAFRQEAEDAIVDDMGKLHNQMVSFIAAANIPLTHVVMVLDMLKRETLDQAYKQYLGE
jgi:hypothetical protein